MVDRTPRSGVRQCASRGEPRAKDLIAYPGHKTTWGAEHYKGQEFGEAKATVGATVLTLDGYCKAARVDRVDVIKLDVDGYECDVLNGGREMIGRCKPVFVMEFAPSALQERGESLDALLACLLPFGYRFYGLDGNPLPDNASALRLLIREGESINVIANVSGGSAAQ